VQIVAEKFREGLLFTLRGATGTARKNLLPDGTILPIQQISYLNFCGIGLRLIVLLPWRWCTLLAVIQLISAQQQRSVMVGEIAHGPAIAPTKINSFK